MRRRGVLLGGHDGDFTDPVDETEAAKFLELMSEILKEVYQSPAKINRRKRRGWPRSRRYPNRFGLNLRYLSSPLNGSVRF